MLVGSLQLEKYKILAVNLHNIILKNNIALLLKSQLKYYKVHNVIVVFSNISYLILDVLFKFLVKKLLYPIYFNCL